jgi:hypothetical protein
LAASRAVEEQSRVLRAEYALAAAEGDADAQAALAEASTDAAMAVLASENLELAIGSARERLARLQAQAEAERLATVRARAVELARERQQLAPELEQALAHLNTVFGAWRSRGQEIAGLRDDNRRLHLPHQTESVRPFLMALPDALRAALCDVPSWVHPDDRRPLAEADPAAALLRDTGELPPAAPDPYFERHAAMVAELGIIDADPEPVPPVEAVPPPAPLKIGDVTPDGLRLVGKLPGGGGVWEPVRPSASAAA